MSRVRMISLAPSPFAHSTRLEQVFFFSCIFPRLTSESCRMGPTLPFTQVCRVFLMSRFCLLIWLNVKMIMFFLFVFWFCRTFGIFYFGPTPALPVWLPIYLTVEKIRRQQFSVVPVFIVFLSDAKCPQTRTTSSVGVAINWLAGGNPF